MPTRRLGVSDTVWLLDVDGVINVSRPGWGAAPRTGNAFCAGVPYRIRWAPALIDRIRAVLRTGLVDIRWCTTWCVVAEEIERLVGLPELGRCWTEPINGIAAAMAKLAAARQVLDDGRRLIWTDDTETPQPGDELYDELAKGGRALLIAPEARCGLQPAHLDMIDEFLRNAC